MLETIDVGGPSYRRSVGLMNHVDRTALERQQSRIGGQARHQ